MHGSVSVESALGIGTTFTFHIKTSCKVKQISEKPSLIGNRENLIQPNIPEFL
jgi:hypothetical protein